MPGFAQDLRQALRSFRRRPGFAFIAVLTLALGIGANTAVFSVVNGVVLERLAFREPDRLVALGGDFISNAEMLYLQQHARQLSDVAAYSPGWGVALTSDGEPLQITAAKASVNLLGMLGVAPLLGRAFSADESVPGRDRVALLSHAIWRERYGGDSAVLGRTVVLDGHPYSILGVLPQDFQIWSQSPVHVLLPVTIDPTAWFHKGQNALGIARLAPGATIESAMNELRGHVPAIREELGYAADYGTNLTLLPLYDYLVGPVRTMLLILLGAVGFIVLIAAANVGNLLLVRASERQREVAVRVALGASGARVLRTVAAESALLALGGTLLGVAFALAGVALLRGLLPADLPRVASIAVDARVLVVCAAVGVAVAAIALLPALASTRANPADALRATRGDLAGRSGARWRHALVSAEIALALVLVVGAGLMLRTLWQLSSVDPGFRSEGVLTFALQSPAGRSAAERRQYFTNVMQRVRALPGVQAVGSIHHLPMAGASWMANVDVEGRALAAGAAPPRAGWRVINGDYLRVMGIALLEGRAFSERDDAGSEPVVLINDVLARRLFAGESAVGKRLRAGNATRNGWVRIVGVTRGVRHEAMELPPEAELYIPAAQLGLAFATVVARTAVEPMSLAGAVRRAVRALDATTPISSLRALETVVRESSARQRLVLRLLSTFAAVGILLAVIGVYGVVAFGVSQRRQEIGIRTALGARRESIVAFVVRRGLRSTLVGLAIGIPAALALTRTMQGLLFDVGTADPLTYAAVVTLLLLAALAASWIPARRAAALDPVTVLKES